MPLQELCDKIIDHLCVSHNITVAYMEAFEVIIQQGTNFYDIDLMYYDDSHTIEYILEKSKIIAGSLQEAIEHNGLKLVRVIEYN